MSRTRYIQIKGELVEVGADYVPDVPEGPMIIDEIPAYTSPVDGRVIDGRAQRREDLKRNACRPYEGREQETKEATRQKAYAEQKRETQLDRVAHEVFYQFPYSKRDILKRI